MDILQGLNAEWESKLDDRHAQMWKRMTALGVQAYWVKPVNHTSAPYSEPFRSDREYRGALDGYQFIIQLGSERLTGGIWTGGNPTEHVISVLIQAANALERRGLTVMRHIP